MPLKQSLSSLLEEIYGLLNHNKNMESLFEFEDRELSMIQEEGENNFLEMNRTWMNEEGGEFSFLKNTPNDKHMIQNFGKGELNCLCLPYL